MTRTPFVMADRFGMPLADTISWCRDHGMAIDAVAFVSEARAAGWNDEKIKQSLLDAFEKADSPDMLLVHESCIDMLLSGDLDK